MPTPKMWKLYKDVEPGSDLHNAIVHAYYHLLRAERGVRAAEGLREMYGDNQFTSYWENVAVDNMLAFYAQMQLIPEWQEYIDMRLATHADRRMRKMYRDVDDHGRKSYPEAEKAASRARRKLRSKYN